VHNEDFFEPTPWRNMACLGFAFMIK